MWPFKKKQKAIKEIEGPAWGHLVNEHRIDVDTLSNEMRCVKQEGGEKEKRPVTYLRVFKLSEVQEKGIEVAGWETFDRHPDLIHFEGYVDDVQRSAHLEQRKG